MKVDKDVLENKPKIETTMAALRQNLLYAKQTF